MSSVPLKSWNSISCEYTSVDVKIISRVNGEYIIFILLTNLKIVNYILKGTTLTQNNDDKDLEILGNSSVKLLDKEGVVIEETFTDNDGQFEFTVFTDEDYILIGEKENYFNTRGGFSTIGKSLDKSKLKADFNDFQNKILKLNLRNSLFVDNTASELIPSTYIKYLKNGVSIVTCNKIANSVEYSNYELLKSLSRNNNSPFFYETNVGAALPVISTLNNLINSGDKIIKIEAVLSGTLNYIFNSFKEPDTFHDIVSKAVDLGFTEPDPKIDLCGIDVSRKILILARESGYNIEFDEVKKNHFLPVSSINTKN